MKITQVEYSRLHSLGNYENEKIGAFADVELDEDPIAALRAVQAWVDTQIGLKQAAADERHQLATLNYQREDAEREVFRLNERATKLRDLLAAHGVKPDDFYGLPF